LQWSPNGLLLAYRPAEFANSIAVLDLATGTGRVVFSAATATGLDYIWRSDGRSILVSTYTQSRAPARELFEAGLDSTAHKLRDMDDAFRLQIIVSNLGVLGGGEGGAANRYAMLPTAGGPPQEIRGATGRRCWPGVSPDRGSLLFLLRLRTEAQPMRVEWVTTAGDSSRTLDLPFEMSGCGFEPPSFHPDGRGVILVGKKPGERTSRIFLLPLDGGPAQVLATFHGTVVRGALAISPDGRSLVYTIEGSPSSTMLEVDAGPSRGAKPLGQRPQQ
jgi:Tol biopolymer transport system component